MPATARTAPEAIKRAIQISVPLLCGISYLILILQADLPSPLMRGLLWASLAAALMVVLPVCRNVPTPSARAKSVCWTALLSAAFFGIWTLFWAAAEEGYIYFAMGKGSAEDGIGYSRYIYGNSGMGYADGFRRLPINLLWTLSIGAIIGLLWGALLTLAAALWEKSVNKSKQPTGETPPPARKGS